MPQTPGNNTKQYSLASFASAESIPIDSRKYCELRNKNKIGSIRTVLIILPLLSQTPHISKFSDPYAYDTFDSSVPLSPKQKAMQNEPTMTLPMPTPAIISFEQLCPMKYTVMTLVTWKETVVRICGREILATFQ